MGQVGYRAPGMSEITRVAWEQDLTNRRLGA